jgi:hypothetical protein
MVMLSAFYIRGPAPHGRSVGCGGRRSLSLTICRGAYKMEVIFVYEKETKNTVRFKEAAEAKDQKVGTIYIKKNALPEKMPKAVKITVEFE